MSYQKLNDETFPSNLFMELEDQFFISPLRIIEPENTVSGAQSLIAGSHLSTSSGNYSLSIENENGSSSSICTNLNAKQLTSKNKRSNVTKDVRSLGSKPCITGCTKKAKSMENLASGTGRGSLIKPQKYGHVKSKVKQFIDEAMNKHDRHILVRHKSMPESTTARTDEFEESDVINQVNNIAMLQTLLKEKTNEFDSLMRHLHFSEIQREEQVSKIEGLKRKIESMRVEETKRQKQREKEREQEKQAILSAYLCCTSHSTLNKSYTSVATQTASDEFPVFNISTFRSDDSFERMLASNLAIYTSTSGGNHTMHTHQTVIDPIPEQDEIDNRSHRKVSPDSATHPDNSPEYPHLTPSTSSVQHLVLGEDISETNRGMATPELCKECADKKVKRRNKKARLASLFCIGKTE